MQTSSPLERFATAWPPALWRNERLLIAVSGGADSVALLRLMLAHGADATRLTIGHVDHGLRPTSGEDRTFVTELALAYGIPCESAQLPVRARAARDGDGIEAAARAERYAWLTATAARSGARYVVTAHTADDVIETVLQRIVRGTGIAGLAGIRRTREPSPGITLIRPCLEMRRAELRAFLHEIGQSWREDESNADPKFLRNRIRHDLLPKILSEYDATADDAILRLAEAAAETQGAIDHIVATLAEERVRYDPAQDAALVRSVTGAECSAFLLRELLVAVWRRMEWPRQAMTRAHWFRAAALFDTGLCSAASFAAASQSERIEFPGGIRATKTTAGIEFRRSS